MSIAQLGLVQDTTKELSPVVPGRARVSAFELGRCIDYHWDKYARNTWEIHDYSSAKSKGATNIPSRANAAPCSVGSDWCAFGHIGDAVADMDVLGTLSEIFQNIKCSHFHMLLLWTLILGGQQCYFSEGILTKKLQHIYIHRVQSETCGNTGITGLPYSNPFCLRKKT